MDFSADLEHLRQRMTGAEQHLIKRLVASFATGDSIVGNNLVLNLYKHVNSPEARMYLSRQLLEEAQHVNPQRPGSAKLPADLICFACCIEGLFFFAAFAYVYFLRSLGLLPGLATERTGCFATRARTSNSLSS